MQCGKETERIIQVFKETQTKVAVRTKNTIKNLIKPWPQRDKYVHQMRYMNFPLKYIGHEAVHSPPPSADVNKTGAIPRLSHVSSWHST
jgi:hypothetical protein